MFENILVICDLAVCGIVGSFVYPRLSIKWGYLVFMSQSRQWRQAATIHLILLPVDCGRAKSTLLHRSVEVQENKIKQYSASQTIISVFRLGFKV